MDNRCPAVYVGTCSGLLTTGVLLESNGSDDSNIQEQLLQEIAKFEGESVDDLTIGERCDKWSVYVKGRFAPIGEIHAIAVLDPDWRP